MTDLRQPILSIQDALNYIYSAFFPNQYSDNTGIRVSLNDNGGLIDPFGKIRVSNAYTIFDSKQVVDNQTLFWSDVNYNGTGTSSVYITGSASTVLSTSANTAGTRVRQTKRRFNYQPGKGFQTILTGILNPNNILTGTLFQLGYFDENNGLFFQLSGTQLAVGIRSSTSGIASDTIFNQQNWNLDTLDGSANIKNKSGVRIDPTKAQIFGIDFQWLGVGRIRWFIEYNGNAIYIHEKSFANLDNKVYMSSPNLPLRYLIQNYGNGPAASMTCICSTAISEGGMENTGFEQSIDRGVNSLTTLNNAAIYPLLAIRLKPNYLGSYIRLTKLTALCDSTSSFRWVVLLNPIVSGTAISYTDLPNSAIQYANNTTNATTVYPGTQLESGYDSQSSGASGATTLDLPSILTLGADVFGNTDSIIFGIQRLSTSAETFYGSLSFRETT